MTSKVTILSSSMLAPIQPFMGILIGAVSFLWGLWVVSPFWSAFERGGQYDLLEALGPEWIWGSIAVLLGTSLIASSWKVNTRWIGMTCLALFYFWGMVCMSYLYSDWKHLAVIQAAYFSLVSGYGYINLKVRRKRGWIDEDRFRT